MTSFSVRRKGVVDNFAISKVGQCRGGNFEGAGKGSEEFRFSSSWFDSRAWGC